MAVPPKGRREKVPVAVSIAAALPWQDAALYTFVPALFTVFVIRLQRQLFCDGWKSPTDVPQDRVPVSMTCEKCPFSDER
jgi:hypothetical protein